jgi:hypothetical protein
MSVTQTQIDEYDSVALIEPLDGWQAGTPAVVQGVRGSMRTIEITAYDESRDILDHILIVDVTQLRLVHKHRRPGNATAEIGVD